MVRGHPARGRARAVRAAGQRQGQGRLVRHLRHRPARVPRRADLHPARRQPAPDHGRDAPAPLGHEFAGEVVDVGGRRQGSRRATASRSSRSSAAATCTACKARRHQPVRAARLLRADGRRRRDVGVRRHAVVHGPRAARRPDERAGRARRADRGRAAGGAPGRGAGGRERARVRRRPDRSGDRPVPARRSAPARSSSSRSSRRAEGQGARDRRRRRHRPDRGGRRRPRARAHRRRGRGPLLRRRRHPGDPADARCTHPQGRDGHDHLDLGGPGRDRPERDRADRARTSVGTIAYTPQDFADTITMLQRREISTEGSSPSASGCPTSSRAASTSSPTTRTAT